MLSIKVNMKEEFFMKKIVCMVMALCLMVIMTGCTFSVTMSADMPNVEKILDSAYTLANNVTGKFWSWVAVPCDAAELTPEQAEEVAARNAAMALREIAAENKGVDDEVYSAAMSILNNPDELRAFAAMEPEPAGDLGDAVVEDLACIEEEPEPPAETEETEFVENPEPSQEEPTPPVNTETTVKVEEDIAEPEEPVVNFTDADEYRYVSASALNFRQGPGTSYDVVKSLSTNTKVHVIGKGDNGWFKVNLDGIICYASGKYLKTEKVVVQAPASTPSQSKESVQEEMARRGNVGRLYINSCGVNVALFAADLSNLSAGQAIVDRKDSAAYYSSSYWGYALIADHRHQGFDGIKKSVAGSTTAYIDFGSYQQGLVCVSRFVGYNGWNGVGGLYTTSGEPVGIGGDLCMYTCNTDGTVTITFWNYC